MLSAQTIQTTINETVASGDYVDVRLTHRVVFSCPLARPTTEKGRWRARQVLDAR
jgi:hypothetical protein